MRLVVLFFFDVYVVEMLLTSFFFCTGEACSLPSDVYAFGVLLNELFSREIPFGGLTELSDIRYGDLKSLHVLNPFA